MPEPRKLPFSLLNTESILEKTDTDMLSVFPLEWQTDNPDEVVNISLELSLKEYVMLASALDVGSDLAYPENSVLIWWLWTTRMISTSFCNRMIDCILNDADTRAAFQGALNPNAMGGDEKFSDKYPNAGTDEIYSSDCNKDKLWSGILEIVTRIDESGRQFLEELVSLNDKAERIQATIDLVPLLGDVIADVADFFTETVPDILNAYEAFSSEAELESIACQIFEQYCSECRYPTYEEFVNFIAGETLGLVPVFSVATLSNVWGSVAGVLTANPRIVWFAINALQSFVIAVDAKFFRAPGRDVLSIWASLGEDVPTDNWEVLCGECPDTWIWQSDFPISENIFEIQNYGGDDLGTYQPTVGFLSADARIAGQSYSRIIILQTEEFAGATIDRVIMNYDYTKGDTDDQTIAAISLNIIKLDDSTESTILNFNQTQNGTGLVMEVQLDAPAKAISLLIRSSREGSANFSGVVGLNSITVTGSGVNPFE